jgi:hypothetical protein
MFLQNVKLTGTCTRLHHLENNTILKHIHYQGLKQTATQTYIRELQ